MFKHKSYTFDAIFVVGSIILLIFAFFLLRSDNVKSHTTRLGSAIVNRHFFHAQLANANIYAYRYGKYCGKGTYSANGDKYVFGCHITTRLLVKKQPTPVPPQPTPSPLQPTPVVVPPTPTSCSDDRSCALAALSFINQERTSHNISPLTIDWNMSFGDGTCIGAKGHSVHMSLTGQLAHDQFPADVCGFYSTAGENIGFSSSTDMLSAFQQINQEMLAEPWTPGCNGNHHCNINSRLYSQIGIGFGSDGTNTWFTSDFKG